MLSDCRRLSEVRLKTPTGGLQLGFKKATIARRALSNLLKPRTQEESLRSTELESGLWGGAAPRQVLFPFSTMAVGHGTGLSCLTTENDQNGLPD